MSMLESAGTSVSLLDLDWLPFNVEEFVLILITRSEIALGLARLLTQVCVPDFQ